LATTIETELENVEFNGATIGEHQAKDLTAQAQQLINEAAALS